MAKKNLTAREENDRQANERLNHRKSWTNI